MFGEIGNKNCGNNQVDEKFGGDLDYPAGVTLKYQHRIGPQRRDQVKSQLEYPTNQRPSKAAVSLIPRTDVSCDQRFVSGQRTGARLEKGDYSLMEPYHSHPHCSRKNLDSLRRMNAYGGKCEVVDCWMDASYKST